VLNHWVKWSYELSKASFLLNSSCWDRLHFSQWLLYLQRKIIRHILTSQHPLGSDQDASCASSVLILCPKCSSVSFKNLSQVSRIIWPTPVWCLISYLGQCNCIYIVSQIKFTASMTHQIKRNRVKMKMNRHMKMNSVFIYRNNYILWNMILTSMESSRACLNTSKSSCVTVSLLPTRKRSVFSCLMLSLISVSVI